MHLAPSGRHVELAGSQQLAGAQVLPVQHASPIPPHAPQDPGALQVSVAGSHDPSLHVAPAQHGAPAVPHAAHMLLAQTLPAWHCPAQQGWPF